jgi:hypothetical protein
MYLRAFWKIFQAIFLLFFFNIFFVEDAENLDTRPKPKTLDKKTVPR